MNSLCPFCNAKIPVPRFRPFRRYKPFPCPSCHKELKVKSIRNPPFGDAWKLLPPPFDFLYALIAGLIYPPEAEFVSANSDTIGQCDQCKQKFSYALIHNGFNDTAYAYCDSCGCTAFFDAWKPRPNDIPMQFHQCIGKEVEGFIRPCVCGGHFKAGASPRCPHCKHELSADLATTYIEANAPGTAQGWRWQKNWTGLYAMIVEKLVAKDPWLNT
jgi:hypothetical protein